MLKQYFVDGLVSIAIVLSILRTDLNNFNREFVDYPEVQEIILGQTAAYTQTNFHINTINSRLGSPEIYRKNIEPDYIFNSAFYRDLRSFRPRQNSDLNVQTFLLVAGSVGPVLNSQDVPEHNDNNDTEDENNNNVQNGTTLTSEDLELEAENLLSTLEERIGALQGLQGTEPLQEDLDLIQALWEQDIDLGVGKEVFDANLRRELEREREIELQKEQQKQKEEELLQKKLEEQRRHAQQRWLHDNFTQDGETGEWVPMGGSRVPPPPPDMGNINGQEQFISTFDSIPMMGDGLPQENNYQVPQAPPQYQGPQPILPQSNQTLYNNMGQYNQQLNPAGMGYRPQQQPVQCNMGQAFHQVQQQQQYNTTANYTHQQHNYTHVQNMSQNINQHHHHQQQQQQQQQQNYPRQSSLEATWQDLVNLLDLPLANQSRVVSSDQGLMNNTVGNHSMAPMPNTSSMLIQNASMPTPAPMNGNVTFNNSGMVSQCHRSPPQSSGMMSPCGENFNSSMPSGSGLGNLNWDSCGDFIFPNITSDFHDDPTEPIDNVDELLPDLITEDELEDINFSEMGLTDALTPTPSGNKGGDDASSDSAVSFGSESQGSPEQNDFSDSAMSPFDGLEGATGGQEASRFSKINKYDPDDFKYSNSCSYSSGGDSNGSNFSASSNDTGGGSSFGQSNGHGCYSPGGNGHVNHNHTYPLKPGADPRDIKRNPYNNNKEGKHKGPQSKDNKRVEELKIPFTVDQIVNSPVEEFNEMITRHKFSDQQLQLIRDIRRRGKNKVAAQNCRKRKIGVIEHLEDEMTAMERMRDKLLHERHVMDKQTREMKEKLGLLYSEIFHSLRDEHGQPYDPARYSLQQSSDGDVFLVPRNYTSEEELNKKRKGERK